MKETKELVSYIINSAQTTSSHDWRNWDLPPGLDMSCFFSDSVDVNQSIDQSINQSIN